MEIVVTEISPVDAHTTCEWSDDPMGPVPDLRAKTCPNPATLALSNFHGRMEMLVCDRHEIGDLMSMLKAMPRQ